MIHIGNFLLGHGTDPGTLSVQPSGNFLFGHDTDLSFRVESSAVPVSSARAIPPAPETALRYFSTNTQTIDKRYAKFSLDACLAYVVG